MYDIGRKKQRWYRRECRRLLRFIDGFKPSYSCEEPFNYETIKLYANLFFKPKGSFRRELVAALLQKTEEIIADKPADLGFCKVVLAVHEQNVAWSNITLFFDKEYYRDFWNRSDIQFQKWTKVNEPSFAKSLSLETDLNECCYLEEVKNDEDDYKQKIWFYGEI